MLPVTASHQPPAVVGTAPSHTWPGRDWHRAVGAKAGDVHAKAAKSEHGGSVGGARQAVTGRVRAATTRTVLLAQRTGTETGDSGCRGL